MGIFRVRNWSNLGKTDENQAVSAKKQVQAYYCRFSILSGYLSRSHDARSASERSLFAESEILLRIQNSYYIHGEIIVSSSVPQHSTKPAYRLFAFCACPQGFGNEIVGGNSLHGNTHTSLYDTYLYTAVFSAIIMLLHSFFDG